MSGRRCDRTHGRFGSAQIETNKFQSTLPEGGATVYVNEYAVPLFDGVWNALTMILA